MQKIIIALNSLLLVAVVLSFLVDPICSLIFLVPFLAFIVYAIIHNHLASRNYWNRIDLG